MHFITHCFTLFRNALKNNRFIALVLAGFVILSMLFFMLSWALMTKETMVFFFTGYIAFATAFITAFIVLVIQEDPHKKLPKHKEYKAVRLTQEEQNAWKIQIKAYLEKHYGKWSKLASASYFEIQGGVVIIAFPYNASVPALLDHQPMLAEIPSIRWRLWLGVKVHNTSQPHLFPADISIIRDLRIKDPHKVRHLFEKAKTEMQRYL